MEALKQFLKKYIIPESLLKTFRPFYHGLLALVADFYFGRPSSKMVVIGVTGTAGKSTTVQMLARILNYHSFLNPSPSRGGKAYRCGFITTISFFDGEQEHINKHGLSMPGGPLLQKQLCAILDRGCKYAVVECTSEGLAQNRHLGINFDMAVFTNLSPAHLDNHGGSFEKYKQAKGKLFKAVGRENAGKAIVVNLDDGSAEYFLKFRAQKKVAVSFAGKESGLADQVFQAKEVDQGFELDGKKFEVKLFGKFNNQNAGLAAVAAKILGVSLTEAARAISNFDKIRGRMETVSSNRNIIIIVDYGCEPATIKAALLSAKELPHKKLIHVFGATGGHRDVGKRFEFGKISAELADEIIITNDDVYDSDPEEITKNIESGIRNQKLRAGKYEIILDRQSAIRRALEIAQPGDVVLITGKGSEQFLVLPGNKRIVWDDVSVVKQELDKISNF